MSVSLTPINNPDGSSVVDVSNGTWRDLTKAAAPHVAVWNGLHDPQTYTPDELRAIAKTVPVEWASLRIAEGLEQLAHAGGAILG